MLTCRILTLVENVAQSVPIPPDEMSLVFPLDFLAVAVMDLNPDEFRGQDFSINIGEDVDFGDDTTISSTDISFESSQQATASVTLPENLLRDMVTPGMVPRITNAAYLTDALFSRQVDRNDSVVVGSVIVAASLSVSNSNGEVENVRVTNLDPPIRLIFLKSPSLVGNSSNPSCNFWDFKANGEYANFHTSF